MYGVVTVGFEGRRYAIAISIPRYWNPEAEFGWGRVESWIWMRSTEVPHREIELWKG